MTLSLNHNTEGNGLWENHQIWQNSSPRLWWRICSLPGAPVFSDWPWHCAPPLPLWHFQGSTQSWEQDQQPQLCTSHHPCLPSTTLLLQPSLQLPSLSLQHQRAQIHCKQKGLNHCLLVSGRGQWNLESYSHSRTRARIIPFGWCPISRMSTIRKHKHCCAQYMVRGNARYYFLTLK